jgi:hypothetical protein
MRVTVPITPTCLWNTRRWCSECAVEDRPALRWLPGTPEPVAVDDILVSLQALDREGLH